MGHVEKVRPMKVRILFQNGLQLWIEDNELTKLYFNSDNLNIPDNNNNDTNITNDTTDQVDNNSDNHDNHSDNHIEPTDDNSDNNSNNYSDNHSSDRDDMQIDDENVYRTVQIQPNDDLDIDEESTVLSNPYMHNSPSSGIPNYDLWRPGVVRNNPTSHNLTNQLFRHLLQQLTITPINYSNTRSQH